MLSADSEGEDRSEEEAANAVLGRVFPDVH